jgi:hypothetical protein
MTAIRGTFVVGLILCACTSVVAQLPPQTVRQEAQQRTERLAMELAQKNELALAARLGELSREASTPIRIWSATVARWKKEGHAGAGPLLADGVLLDCLSRIRDVKTPWLPNDPATPFPSDLAGVRAGQAVKAFDAALKADPSLIEARLRSARIRAPKNASAAAELERIAGDQDGYPFSYLAAIARAEAARAGGDDPVAVKWYRAALTLLPQSTAAAIGLSTLSPGASPLLDAAGAADPYYSYQCTVLTPDVSRALASRMKALPRR